MNMEEVKSMEQDEYDRLPTLDSLHDCPKCGNVEWNSLYIPIRIYDVGDSGYIDTDCIKHTCVKCEYFIKTKCKDAS